MPQIGNSTIRKCRILFGRKSVLVALKDSKGLNGNSWSLKVPQRAMGIDSKRPRVPRGRRRNQNRRSYYNFQRYCNLA